MATDLGYSYDRHGDRVAVADLPDPTHCPTGARIAADGTCCVRHDTDSIPTPSHGIDAAAIDRAKRLTRSVVTAAYAGR